MTPLISFLTSAYRTERYVGDTIASVLAQTRADWEMIVVDNGNSEEMARVVEQYTGDPRVKLVRQANNGMLGGITAAADVAIGRYLCPLDSDDELLPDFCERVGAVIDAEPSVDAVGCDAELFWETDDSGHSPFSYFDSVGRRSLPDPSRAVLLDEMLEDGVPSYFGAFRREAWDKHRAFDVDRSDVEPDVVLWLGLAAAGRDIRVLPCKLARQRIRSDSLSHDTSGVLAFEARLERSLMAVDGMNSSVAVANSRQVRRLRYNHAMRRARSALLIGDVQAANTAVDEAYGQRRTLRCAAVLVALRISPRLLQSIHPVKNRLQNALRRVSYAGGSAR